MDWEPLLRGNPPFLFLQPSIFLFFFLFNNSQILLFFITILWDFQILLIWLAIIAVINGLTLVNPRSEKVLSFVCAACRHGLSVDSLGLWWNRNYKMLKDMSKTYFFLLVSWRAILSTPQPATCLRWHSLITMCFCSTRASRVSLEKKGLFYVWAYNCTHTCTRASSFQGGPHVVPAGRGCSRLFYLHSPG